MFKKLLLAALISVGAATVAKAQYVTYDPIYPNQPPQSNAENSNVEVQVLTGYIIDQTTSNVSKIKLKVAQVQKRVIIVGLKELSAERWNEYTVNRPVAQKLQSYENFADQFEYKVYVPVLGKVVYF